MFGVGDHRSQVLEKDLHSWLWSIGLVGSSVQLTISVVVVVVVVD